MMRIQGIHKRLIYAVIAFVLAFSFAEVGASAQTVIHAEDQEAFSSAITKLHKKLQTESKSEQGPLAAVYSMKTLMVKTKGTTFDWSPYQPATVITDQRNHIVLQFEKEEDCRQAKNKIEQLKSVEYVQEEVAGRLSMDQKTSEVGMSSAIKWSWGIDKLGSRYFVDKIQSAGVNKSLTVAIVDSGIYKHPALSGRILSGKNFIDDSNYTVDDFGHGTHVTGIVYDTMRGVDVKFLPVKVFNASGLGTGFDMANGIFYAADHGAKVINLSGNLNYGKHDSYLHESVAYAVKKGATVVFSAGNNGRPASNCCPADLTEAIVVGAATESDQLADFSNYGKPMDMIAPGNRIYSTYRDGDYVYMSGTSMAAPHISGMAGLIKIMNPSFSPAQIETKLKKLCRDLGPAGWDSKTGWGMPDLGIPATGVSLDKTKISLQACNIMTLNASVLPAATTNKAVSWDSSNHKVAEVKNGLVIAKNPGTATITAKTANGKKANCTLTVTKADRYSWQNLQMTSYNASTGKCCIKGKLVDVWSDGIQIEVDYYNKENMKTKLTESYSIFSGLKENRVYYYRARSFSDIMGVRVFGDWSYRRGFSTAKAAVSVRSDQQGVNIKIPKVSGVNYFTIYCSSSNQAGSYVKLWKGECGKSYKFTKFQNKALSSYGKDHKFYLVIKPDYQIDIHKDSTFPRTVFTLQ